MWKDQNDQQKVGYKSGIWCWHLEQQVIQIPAYLIPASQDA